MSILKNRVLKLEQSQQSTGLVLLAVDEGETNEEAYQRFFSDGAKPKAVIYVSPLDVML